MIKSLDDLLFSSSDSDDSKLRACEAEEEDCELGAVGPSKRENFDQSLETGEDDFDADDLKEFLDDMMIQTSNMPFQHPRSVMPPSYGAHGTNNLFQSPYYHHHPHHHHHAHHHVS